MTGGARDDAEFGLAVRQLEQQVETSRDAADTEIVVANKVDIILDVQAFLGA